MPRDLVVLSKMKTFRSMLMSLRVEPLWKYARERFGYAPECPFDAAEQWWAELLFSDECQVNYS